MKHIDPDIALGASGMRDSVRLLHIVPEDAIGGVEIAARRSGECKAGQIRVHFLKRGPDTTRSGDAVPGIEYGQPGSALGIGNAIAAVRAARELDPDVVLFSLWKAVVAFVLIKIFVRGPKLVLFLHSDRSTHFLDSLATNLMVCLCDAVWADSRSSLEGRLGLTSGRPTRVISFLLYRPTTRRDRQTKPRFVYWGRLNRTKGIDEAIKLFHRVAEQHSDALFSIIGPDSGVQDELERQVQDIGLADKIRFRGALSMTEIEAEAADASFFLQLSKQEGMAMSVVEAMQLGLVPIVTKVGEIASYCRDGENAVVYDTIDETAQRIDALMADSTGYRRMCGAAIAQWANAPLYPDDILLAVHELSADVRACSGLAA